MKNKLLRLYETLYTHFGPQHWWPGDTPLEIMVGAVLTQNTNWGNVSRAIDNIKQYGLLSLAALDAMPPASLAELIRPSGYYNLKAARLKNLLAFIQQEYQGDLDLFFALDLPVLRENLLAVKGIGPETADSIILYAAQQPIFVVDAYTHRILFRHQLIDDGVDYYEIQELFMDSLPEDVQLYNEYHALLVRLGKDFCKKSKPLCDDCPVKDI